MRDFGSVSAQSPLIKLCYGKVTAVIFSNCLYSLNSIDN